MIPKIIFYVLFFMSILNKGYCLSLKDPVIVTGKYITLGDILEGPINYSDSTFVMRAPNPGQKLSLSTEMIQQIINKHNLPSLSNLHDIVIYRKSTSLDAHKIEKMICEALKISNPQNEWKVILDQPNIKIEIPIENQSEPCLERIELNSSQDRFEALLVTYDDDCQPSNTKIVGRLIKIISVPVLNKNIIPGNIIRAENIDYRKVRKDQLANNIIINQEHLIDMTPKSHVLKEGEFVRSSDLTIPKIIQKGTEVSLILRTKNMVLIQRKVQALEGGAIGDNIKVCNMSSKKILIGKIKDANTVEVENVS